MCISALFTTPVTCGCKPRRTRGDRDVNPTQLTHFKLQRLGKSNFTASYLLKPPLLSIDLVFMKHRDSHDSPLSSCHLVYMSSSDLQSTWSRFSFEPFSLQSATDSSIRNFPPYVGIPSFFCCLIIGIFLDRWVGSPLLNYLDRFTQSPRPLGLCTRNFQAVAVGLSMIHTRNIAQYFDSDQTRSLSHWQRRSKRYILRVAVDMTKRNFIIILRSLTLAPWQPCTIQPAAKALGIKRQHRAK